MAGRIRRSGRPRALEPLINELWPAAEPNEDARELLLELMWKSGGKRCIPLANNAALSQAYSPYHRMLAVHTLKANQVHRTLRKIATDLLATGGGWPRRAIASVASVLFGEYLSVAELLQLADKTPETRHSTEGFHWHMKVICGEVPLGPDADRLRDGLARLIDRSKTAESSVYQPLSSKSHLAAGLRALCARQLEGGAWGLESDFATACVIAHRYRTELEGNETSATAQLVQSAPAGLRQAIFWQEVSFARRFGETGGWGLAFAAIHGSVLVDFLPSDRQWLLTDLQMRSTEEDRAVALNGLLWIWRRTGGRASDLKPYRSACAGNSNLLKVISEATAPSPYAAKHQELEVTRAARTAQNELENELRLLSWDAWRHEVLADPLRAFDDAFARNNVRHMVEWLAAGSAARSEAWAPERVVRAFSQEVLELLEAALKRFWRDTNPQLRSERPASERDGYPTSWLVGAVGVFVESRDRGWADKLSITDARLAVRHAALELNGFPEWLEDVARSHPQIIQEVLGRELREQVRQASGSDSIHLLQTISYAQPLIKGLVYEVCRDIFIAWDPGALRMTHAAYQVDRLANIVGASVHDVDRPTLKKVCQKRLRASRPGAMSVAWLKALFLVDAAAATSELQDILRRPRGDEAIELLAALFGRYGESPSGWGGTQITARDLASLVRAAYANVPPHNDEVHEDVYTPTVRDHAAHARSFLLQLLVKMPGRAARDEILSLSKDPLFARADLAERLKLLARERAAEDSEFSAMAPADVRALEARLEAAPTTRDTLHALMMDRLEDLQHDVSHHDFSDRRTLRSIEEEVEMQRTLALRLEAKSRDNYAVFRESEVADAKRTDIVLAAAGTLQKSVIEIKLADRRWELVDLEKAITEQLVALYQRHEHCRSGCLLITNNGTRQTWTRSRKRIDWDELLAHLRGVASTFEASRPDLRVDVFGLDLRDTVLPRRRATVSKKRPTRTP